MGLKGDIVIVQKGRSKDRVLFLSPLFQTSEVVDLKNPGAFIPFGIEEDRVHLFKQVIIENDEIWFGPC